MKSSIPIKITNITAKNGTRGVSHLYEDKEYVGFFTAGDLEDKVAQDFIKKIQHNPELIKEIKGVQSKHSINESSKTQMLMALGMFRDMCDLSEARVEASKKLYPGALKFIQSKLKEIDTIKKDIRLLAGEYSLDEFEIDYLNNYIIFGEVIGAVGVRIEKHFNEPESYYLKVHNSASSNDVREAWRLGKEYFKESGDTIVKKSYPLIDKLHENIYKKHLLGTTNKELADEYKLESEYIAKIIKRFKEKIPDKKK